ncbi:hypothetical protein CPB84DRAFT_1848958 [Gymnopilus junonius]|uniref:Uncharacterized protein n=1 Tax=Gymnopilus junonius TaxID=109634 RepID=A0A9P5NJX5_GYMJU|nr:hypothetical protein CPB84DRAFT_1848958 [Gymnopilus junonius]
MSATSRPSVPASGLGNAGYEYFTSCLKNIALSGEECDKNKNYDDEFFDQLTINVRVVGAWLKGRFRNVSSEVIGQVLKLFSPNLVHEDFMLGSEFVALRLIIHAQNRENVNRSLAFVHTVPFESAGTDYPRFTTLHRECWGRPIDHSLTTLPNDMALDGPPLSCERSENMKDDVLPGEPFLKVFGKQFLVRA